MLLLAHLLLLPRAGLPLQRGWVRRGPLAAVGLAALLLIGVRGLGRRVDLVMSAPTIGRWAGGSRGWRLGRLLLLGSRVPLRWRRTGRRY